MYSNSLTGDTHLDTLTQIKNLKSVDLSFNDFSGTIPPSIGNWGGIENIVLESTNLKGMIPPEIKYLELLKSFIVSDNHLSGVVPSEISMLRNASKLKPWYLSASASISL